MEVIWVKEITMNETTQKIETRQPAKKKQRHWRHNHGGVVGALFLIFIGLVFLGNTTGAIPWGVWDYLWRLWPLILIFVGLDMLFGHTRTAAIISAIVAIVLFVFVGWWALVSVNAPLVSRWNIATPSWIARVNDTLDTRGDAQTTTQTIYAADYPDVTQRELGIDVGAGTFTLNDALQADPLVLRSSYYTNFGEPKLTVSQTDKTLVMEFSQRSSRAFFGFNNQSPQYDFSLGQSDQPTNITVDIGAGKGDISLTGAPVGTFEASVGAGELVTAITEAVAPAKTMKIDVGAGKATVILPRSVGYRLSYDVGVGSLKVDSKEITRSKQKDSTLISENFGSAKTVVELDVSVGVGEFNLEFK